MPATTYEGAARGACAEIRKTCNNPMRGLLRWKPPVGLALLEARSGGIALPHPCRRATPPWSALRGPKPAKSGRGKQNAQSAQRPYEGGHAGACAI